MSIENITVPDLGDVSEVEVIELLVSVGQEVEENDSLLVLESDKAAMEIPAPMAGIIKSIAVNLGDKVSSGSAMLSLEVAEDATAEPVSEVAAEIESPAEEENEPEAAVVAVSSKTNTESVIVDVPDLGTDDEVEVIEIHVSVGDEVAIDESLITLETDKAAMEVPAEVAGTVESLLLAVGDKVKTGAAILQLKAVVSAAVETKATAEPIKAESKSAAPTKAEPAPTQQQESTPAASNTSERVYAGPAVRKLARELGVNLGQVSGSGAKSRITKDDVHKFVKQRINAPAAQGSVVPAIPDIDFSQFGEVEEVQRSNLHKLTATKMHRDWASIPHVAQFNEADVTDLEDFRAGLKAEAESKGTRLTFLPFLLKACANTLAEYPQFNVALHSSGEHVIQKKYIHIGVAVATEAGLVVPVIRNVDQKSIWQLATEVIEITNKAKQRKLRIEDMQGGCFSISSLGAIGGTGFIPIVNAPEVAILGVGKTEIKPVYIDGEFVPRKMLPLTLSYDHRAVNGVDGGLFSTHLVKLLADIRHLSL